MARHHHAPSDPRHAALAVLRTLRDAGHIAYFAGGCVRDELLGLAPSDYDVATDATPDRITALFPSAALVGAAFGVVIVRHARASIEVATFRADGPYSDRRRPDSIVFSTPEADAHRRDFTVNALFLDPLAPPGQQVIDFVDGRADLQRRVLRAVGDPHQRLEEDHLRALRAARLAAKLDFSIDPATANAIRARSAKLLGVSRERIGEEIRRILLHPSRARAVEILHDLDLLRPTVYGPTVLPTDRHALRSLPPEAPIATCLAALALDLGPDGGPFRSMGMAGEWRRALCLSNQERDDVWNIFTSLRAMLPRSPDPVPGTKWLALPVALRKRSAAARLFSEALVLCRIIQPEVALVVEADVAALAATPSGLAPTPLVTGRDLLALGVPPGPTFKRVLDTLYDAQLEGRIQNSAQGLELARSLIVQP